MYNIVRQRWMVLGMTLVSCILVGASVSSAPNTLVRDSIPEQYKWDLSNIYSDWNAWESDCARVSAMIDTLAGLKGQPSKGAESLLKVLQYSDRVGEIVNRVTLYADLSYVTNQADNDLNARSQRAAILSVRQSEATTWLQPELLQLPWETVSGWIDQTAGLAIYRYTLDNLFRLKPHTLDENGEKLLSYYSSFNNTPDAVYSGFIYSDIQYNDYVSKTGDTILLTEPQIWYQIRTNRDQEERRRMFETFYQAYQVYVNTYAAMYNSVLQRDWAEARARNYPTALEASLSNNDVPSIVYENQVNTVRNGVAPLQRYHRLRKQVLGLDHYYWSDRQIPLVEREISYEYDEIVPWVIEALKPLGEDYAQRLKDLFGNRRIDVYENNDKYTGGFQSDTYGTPQYILLNFNGTLEEVFTVAHEAGHAIHSNYSNTTQPYVNSSYTIFVAEVASTLNEALFLDYLVQKAKTSEERIAMLQRAIEGVEQTFYLQTMFADFEWQAHKLVEAGEPVTADALRAIYGKLTADYYGDAVEVDSLFYSYWTRIGHFFSTPYYVYKYATSFAASAQVVQGIQSKNSAERKKALDNYLGMLKSGGSEYPMDQLRKCGVDLAKPDAIQAVVDRLDALVTRLELELKKR
ncbi:MAG: oligoendopeptidase F [candidate division Zixibacteria bacterium]|nr:oligoendopeptidase F [candidate division Zixibacteria bacterium]